MSAPQPGPREIAHGLVLALRPALPADAPRVARLAARDVAQLLALPGLDAALALLESHSGATRPAEIEHLAERLARTADAAERDGDLGAFAASDADFGSLSAQLGSLTWGAAGVQSPAVVTLSAAEVLAGLPVNAHVDLERLRLRQTVAASLRAAIDWLGFDQAPRLDADAHDTALMLSGTLAHEGGLGPAGAVLAAMEGSLAPEGDARWTLRVPLAVERPSFLLVRQGRLAIALPWHAVDKLKMMTHEERAQLREPVLAPLAPLEGSVSDRPTARIALGLTRAWFVADRIVWRIAAEPHEAEAPGPFADSARFVRVESGERYWIAPASALLRDVPPIETPAPAPRPRVAAVAETLDAAAVVASEPVAAPTVETPEETPPVSAPEAAIDDALRAVFGDEAFLDVPPGASGAPEFTAPAPPAPPVAPASRASGDSGMFTARLAVLRAENVRPREAAPPVVEAVAPPPAPVAPPVDVPPVAEEPEASLVEEVEAEAALPPVAPPPVVEPEAGAKTPPVAVVIQPSPEPAIAPAPIEPPAPSSAPAAVAAAAVNARAVPHEPARERPSEVAARHPVRRALVADDSLVARIFLSRLLEQRGFVVEMVSTAAAMWSELERGPWAVVCADVSMPDAPGSAHLGGLLDFRATSREPFVLVALTRDTTDEQLASRLGSTLHLRKPFEPEHLDRILHRALPVAGDTK